MKCIRPDLNLQIGTCLMNSLIVFGLFFGALGFGCTSIYTERKPQFSVETKLSTLERQERKSLFVFLDGTGNDSESRTNVWRLYKIVNDNENPFTHSIYIEGVGNQDNPLSGMILGYGMQERILMGYEFLAQKYNPGDKIYIFGFSRGAHQARALAGFLAYSGLPKASDENRDQLMHIGERILKLTKKESDQKHDQAWSSWLPGQPPLLSKEIKKNHPSLEMQTAEVAFLGVWDTVPGSAFKDFGLCKEKKDRKPGDRYKSGSYPGIRQIAHAVSIDEKRSKFAPLFVCPPINPKYTKVTEVWFPGAHGDVGGGYTDSRGLPEISLNWMLALLAQHYTFKNGVPLQKGEDAKGLAHWSIGDFPANLLSHCSDRQFLPKANIDKSFQERRNADKVPIRIDGKEVDRKYPIQCETEE